MLSLTDKLCKLTLERTLGKFRSLVAFAGCDPAKSSKASSNSAS